MRTGNNSGFNPIAWLQKQFQTSPSRPQKPPSPPPRPAQLGGGDRANAAVRPRDNMSGTVSFPSRPGDPTLDQMAASIRNYPGSKATSVAASREIAQAAHDAATQFGVDPRQLLAIWARESQFDPGASQGNGKGLGQLTNPAVAELRRIGRGGSDGHRAGVNRETYAMLRTPEARASFERLSNHSARLSVRDNATGSAAYLRLMMDVNNGNQNSTLRGYNASGGAVERAYPGHVSDAYRQLWGSAMPGTLQMR